MRTHASLTTDTDANAAASEALKGAAVGAAKYGLPLILLALIGQSISPAYRALTPPFKLFVQMSGMTVGGMVEADRWVRAYGEGVRRRGRGLGGRGVGGGGRGEGEKGGEGEIGRRR
ncbi:hypothetical protein MMC26_004479 [Xylographa opegraphella]|nr:hypothetical protein [Xylographa opegraphella]